MYIYIYIYVLLVGAFLVRRPEAAGIRTLKGSADPVQMAT